MVPNNNGKITSLKANKELNICLCQWGRNTCSIYHHTIQLLPGWKAKWINEGFSGISDLFIYVFIHPTTNYRVELHCMLQEYPNLKSRPKTKQYKTFLHKVCILMDIYPQRYFLRTLQVYAVLCYRCIWVSCELYLVSICMTLSSPTAAPSILLSHSFCCSLSSWSDLFE